MVSGFEKKTAALLRQGASFERRNDDASAVACYEEAIILSPEDPRALHRLGNLENRQGNTVRAIELLQLAIQRDPARAEAYVCLGTILDSAGHSQKAMHCYRKALSISPDLPSALTNAGRLLLHAGRFRDAIEWLEKAKEAGGFDSGLLLSLGRAYLAEGLMENAAEAFEHLLHIEPRSSQAHFYRGVIHQTGDNPEAALACYRQALSIDAAFAEAHLNMGLIYARLGDPTSARKSYTRALDVNPDMPEALNNVGNLLMETGTPKEALDWYQRAHANQPGALNIYLNLANCYRQCMLFQDAIGCYERILEQDPDAADAYLGLGSVYKELRKADRAIACFQKVLTLNPRAAAAYEKLAIVYNDLGESRQARACLDRKIHIQPDFADEVKRAMIMPVIYDSVDEIDVCRKTFVDELEQLLGQAKRIHDPHRQIGATNFILALHGKNERPIRETLASFYRSICPDLEWTSPWLPAHRSGKRVRIGMLSKFFNNTTIGSLYHGLIENLPKSKFRLSLLRLPGKEDELSRRMAEAADEVVTLPPDFRKAREIVARKQLDVLFYPEIGMDALTYFIAFSRLAPVQCKRGFQITTGIPAVDYFISSDAAEPMNAQRFYSERLVRLKGTGYYYHRPPKPARRFGRTALGLPEKQTLYLCPQSLFKLHPDFDPLLEAVLRKDPNGCIVLLEGHYEQWKKQLLKRLSRTIGEGLVRRVRFVPRMPREQFLQLYLLADAVIDTIHFSGGHTSLECFAWSIPVVTLPTEMLPGRLTYGFYRQMEIMDCVAEDVAGYAEIACRLANDTAWRDHIRQKIARRSKVLFENRSDVEELAAFLLKAVDIAYDSKCKPAIGN